MALLWHSCKTKRFWPQLTMVKYGQITIVICIRKVIMDAFEFAKENVDRHHEWSWFGTTGALPYSRKQILDLILTSLPGQFQDIHSPDKLSNHDIVAGTLKVVIPCIKKTRRKVYLYQKGDYESMRKDALEFVCKGKVFQRLSHILHKKRADFRRGASYRAVTIVSGLYSWKTGQDGRGECLEMHLYSNTPFVASVILVTEHLTYLPQCQCMC